MATVSPVTMEAPVDAATPVRSRRLALLAMLFAVAMTFIDQTIVAIAAPSIQTHLGLTSQGTRWAVNAYLLGLAATFALGGRLADVIGSRRMVIIGIVGFAGSSAMCGLTPAGPVALSWIVTFRLLQGISGALMIPAATAVVVAAFPVQERGRALAIFFTVSGALTAIGPDRRRLSDPLDLAGDLLDQRPDRRARARAHRRLPVAAHRRRQRIDVRGAVLVCAGMALSVLGFEQAQAWTWHTPAPWACIGAGALVLAVFAAVEARVQMPLIRVRIFRDRAFLIDNLVLFFSDDRVRAGVLLRQRLLAGLARLQRQPGRSLPAAVLRRVRTRCPNRRADAGPAWSAATDRARQRPCLHGVRALGRPYPRTVAVRAMALHRHVGRWYRTLTRARKHRRGQPRRRRPPTARSPVSRRRSATTPRLWALPFSEPSQLPYLPTG